MASPMRERKNVAKCHNHKNYPIKSTNKWIPHKFICNAPRVIEHCGCSNTMFITRCKFGCMRNVLNNTQPKKKKNWNKNSIQLLALKMANCRSYFTAVKEPNHSLRSGFHIFLPLFGADMGFAIATFPIKIKTPRKCLGLLDWLIQWIFQFCSYFEAKYKYYSTNWVDSWKLQSVDSNLMRIALIEERWFFLENHQNSMKNKEV